MNQDARIDNSLIGAAGVHYAAYKLTRRGMLALPTVRNTPGTDLIVTSLDGRHHANSQVKTTQSPTAKFWIICSAKKLAKLPFGEHNFYVLLRPRRPDDPVEQEVDEFEGFMLTAQEAKQEMQANLHFRKEQEFPLSIWVDKGGKQQSWGLPEGSKEKWRERWRTWKLEEES